MMGQSQLLAHSFLKSTGKQLINESNLQIPIHEALYNAPFALVSHGVEPDPIFNYANVTAQKLWELNWEQFTQLPSRLSAEPMEQSERNMLLAEAKLKGFISNYSGIRISSTGNRFKIINTYLWNIYDDNNNYKGQAAMFDKWNFI